MAGLGWSKPRNKRRTAAWPLVISGEIGQVIEQFLGAQRGLFRVGAAIMPGEGESKLWLQLRVALNTLKMTR